MKESISLSDYLKRCKPFLLQDKPEAVQDIFKVMNAAHSEFRQFFVKQIHTTIREHYLVAALNPTGDSAATFTGWESVNPEWPKKLQSALYAGRVGECARMQKMSLLQYEADQNAAGR
ncbi:Uncharacterised protein [Klebsiella quasipneumoniae]|uniref:hypothetical protein n=1 Tax=Klebsiella pneumoniae complex TaxID=3390273 RepID=UPI001083ED6F|nr:MULTISPECIES: hypothetical protein [Klebsiella]HCM7833991.1 hypothetical protein [Klebsiella quasipneumoniae subsp. quasipneumoniae]HDU4452004.1 hypothetical protein [Klebsiella pneumoniae subsp. pneumoniae]WPG80639.1 hypothetical protein SG622_26540 [Klebsiella pneumoniae]WPG86001.1 hypothetical protein SG621_26775 [Klebsiella pneumoniae]WPG91418.1 hypothetical protein SG620_26775 [Klebsiella pneumoniae]